MSSEIRDTFPELEQIEDEELREKVIRGYEIALSEGNFDSLTEAPWVPEYAEEVGDQSLLQHIRDVTALATTIADQIIDRRDATINRDHVIAGSLVHDISKFFEFDGDSDGEVRDYVGHPHFCVYPLQKAKMPISIQHIALSHTPRSSIEPKTIEAVIVKEADQLAMDAIFVEATDSIKRMVE